MKVAITISGDTIDAPFDTRFGRAAAFCVVESETGEWVVRDNPGLSASGGAGVQAAQEMAELGVQAVISGAFGPNAFTALGASGIAMCAAPPGVTITAREALSMFQRSELMVVGEAARRDHPGGDR